MSTRERLSIPEDFRSVYGYVDEDKLYSHSAPALGRARRALYATTRGSGLDDVVKETMRLRNARLVDCDVCKNVRIAAARDQGLVEEMADDIDEGYEASARLSEEQKAALRLTDAFFLDPAGDGREPGAAFRAALETFTAQEVVLMLVELAKYRTFSKLLITLGLELEDMQVTVVRPKPVLAD